MGISFIIDEKKLKSINQWFHKKNARLQLVKDTQQNYEQTKASGIIE